MKWDESKGGTKLWFSSLKQSIDGGFDRYIPDNVGRDNSGYQGDRHQHQIAGKYKNRDDLSFILHISVKT